MAIHLATNQASDTLQNTSMQVLVGFINETTEEIEDLRKRIDKEKTKQGQDDLRERLKVAQDRKDLWVDKLAKVALVNLTGNGLGISLR